MQPGPTRVDAVVDALVAGFGDLFGEDNVIDGPPAGQDLPDDLIIVGFGGPGAPAIETDVQRAEGLGHRYMETFTIQCLISSVKGDVDMKARRDTCKAWLAQVDAYIRASNALDGTADLVGLGPDASWGQAQTKDGALCEVNFSIVGRAAL